MAVGPIPDAGQQTLKRSPFAPIFDARRSKHVPSRNETPFESPSRARRSMAAFFAITYLPGTSKRVNKTGKMDSWEMYQLLGRAVDRTGEDSVISSSVCDVKRDIRHEMIAGEKPRGSGMRDARFRNLSQSGRGNSRAASVSQGVGAVESEEMGCSWPWRYTNHK